MRRSVLAAALFLGVAAALFWAGGDALEAALADDAGVAWFTRFGGWAWLAAAVLLVADVVLPVPTTAVLAVLGVVYGPWWGGLIGAGGCVCAGLSAYGLCRWLGPGVADALVGADDRRRLLRFFAGEGGAWAVAASRWLPILPELVACAAGLARMPLPRFGVALVCGCAPLGFAWAAVGAWGRDQPGWALVVSVLVPLLLCGLARTVLRRGAVEPA